MSHLFANPLSRASLLFRTNIALGFIVTAVSVYLMATGSYDNIQQRETAETVLTWAGIGGLIYMALFLTLCVFKYDIFSAKNPHL